MIEIPLDATPNQLLSFQVGQQFYNLELKALQDMMYASLTRNNVVISSNSRLVAGGLLLPYQYQEDGGNLAFVTNPGDAPWYEQFGVTQFLIFYTAAELEAARG